MLFVVFCGLYSYVYFILSEYFTIYNKNIGIPGAGHALIFAKIPEPSSYISGRKRLIAMPVCIILYIVKKFVNSYHFVHIFKKTEVLF